MDKHQSFSKQKKGILVVMLSDFANLSSRIKRGAIELATKLDDSIELIEEEEGDNVRLQQVTIVTEEGKDDAEIKAHIAMSRRVFNNLDCGIVIYK